MCLTTHVIWPRMASLMYINVSSVQSLNRIWLFATPWTAACQPSLSITNSQSLLKLKSIESVMSSNHLILCHPLLLPPSIFPGIRVFSSELVFHIRWPKSHHFMSTRQGNNGNSDRVFSWAPKSLETLTAAMKLKDAYSLEGKLWPT